MQAHQDALRSELRRLGQTTGVGAWALDSDDLLFLVPGAEVMMDTRSICSVARCEPCFLRHEAKAMRALTVLSGSPSTVLAAPSTTVACGPMAPSRS